MQLLHSSREGHHFLLPRPPGASWSLLELPGASGSLLESPGASHMPPRCLPDASLNDPFYMIPLPVIPPASSLTSLPWFFELVYKESSQWFLLNDSSSMIPSQWSSILYMIPLPMISPSWFLVIDFSSMILRIGLQRNSVWGLVLGSLLFEEISLWQQLENLTFNTDLSLTSSPSTYMRIDHLMILGYRESTDLVV